MLIRSVLVSHTGEQQYSFIFPDLTAFTQYNITVSAFTMVGEGVANSVVVMTDPFAASPPRNVAVDEIMATSVRLMWDYPEFPRGVILGYFIKITTGGSTTRNINVTLTVADSNGRQMMNITGLDPYILYSFEVRAYSIDGNVTHIGEPERVEMRTGEAGEFISSLYVWLVREREA